MSINLTVAKPNGAQELKPRITVIGVGGAGGNAVNNMIKRELGGIEFLTTNTDAQALLQSKAERRIQLGADLTQGLGAGAKPEIGRAAAEEAIDELLGELSNVNMTFIAAGMGGGTGTGAAPVIAKATREAGILTVGVVTKPFEFEGAHRMAIAEEGIQELEKVVDTLIIIPNQNLFRIANESTTFADAFAMADEVLYSGVRGVTDLIVMPGLINLDFADIRSVMNEMGKAMMGTGEAEGERRALDAAEAAINNPLLEDTSMKGAKGVLINITGSDDITLFEVDEAATRIRSEIDSDARIIVGSAFDGELQGRMRVSVVATGIGVQARGQIPQTTLNLAVPDNELKKKKQNLGEDGAENASQAAEESPGNDEPITVVESESDSIDIETYVNQNDSGINLDTNAKLRNEKEDNLMSGAATSETSKLEEQQIEESGVIGVPQMGATDSFIPPKPISASLDSHSDSSETLKVADLKNQAEEMEGKVKNEIEEAESHRPSLFELVTRTGKAAMGLSNESESKTDTKNGSSIKEKDGEGGRKEPLVNKVAVEEELEKDVEHLPKQNLEKEIDDEASTESNSDKAETEDDLLDIPAFLRRQAN